jgi:hypothetical protein
MEFSITSAAIATIISALTSVLVSLGLNKSNKKKHIDDQLDDILKIAIQYPYVESDAFASTWNQNKNSNNEQYLRYDIYCTLLFNYLSRVADFYRYDKQKIENYIAIKDWIRLHKDYWLNPTSSYENIDGYDPKFRELITTYLK